MAYQGMTTGELEILFPQLGWGVKEAPLTEVIAVIDTVALFLAKDNPAYNPDKLRADRDFAWGHTIQTGTYPGGSYTEHQLCVKSLRTGKLLNNGVSLIMSSPQCGTYQHELTKLSRI